MKPIKKRSWTFGRSRKTLVRSETFARKPHTLFRNIMELLCQYPHMACGVSCHVFISNTVSICHNLCWPNLQRNSGKKLSSFILSGAEKALKRCFMVSGIHTETVNFGSLQKLSLTEELWSGRFIWSAGDFKVFHPEVRCLSVYLFCGFR